VPAVLPKATLRTFKVDQEKAKLFPPKSFGFTLGLRVWSSQAEGSVAFGTAAG